MRNRIEQCREAEGATARDSKAGAVANVDFKMYRSLEDGHRPWTKVESSTSGANIV